MLLAHQRVRKEVNVNGFHKSLTPEGILYCIILFYFILKVTWLCWNLCKHQQGRLNIKHTSSSSIMHHYYHHQHINDNDNDNDHISDATPQCKNQHNTKWMRDREIDSRKNGAQDALHLKPLVLFFFLFSFYYTNCYLCSELWVWPPSFTPP